LIETTTNTNTGQSIQIQKYNGYRYIAVGIKKFYDDCYGSAIGNDAIDFHVQIHLHAQFDR